MRSGKGPLRLLKRWVMASLRYLFQDKRFGGQNFMHLNVRNGMLFVDEESEAWKQMRPKNYQPPYINDVGAIVLPKAVSKLLKNGDNVDYWKISDEHYVVSIIRSSPSKSRLEQLLEETPKKSNVEGWH